MATVFESSPRISFQERPEAFAPRTIGPTYLHRKLSARALKGSGSRCIAPKAALLPAAFSGAGRAGETGPLTRYRIADLLGVEVSYHARFAGIRRPIPLGSARR